MVYFLFEHEPTLSDSAVIRDRRAVIHAPRKAAPSTPRHQLQLHDNDAPAVMAARAGWKPHLLPPVHSSERAPQNPMPLPPRPVREHPHLWRDAVIHAKSDYDA